MRVVKTFRNDITESDKDEMHFICIDKRSRHSNGQTYVQLSDGQEVLLPPSITKVPALLLLNRGYKVLFGDEIANHIAPTVEAMKQNAVVQTGEPMAFGFSGSSSGGFANFGVASDNYSFLDQFRRSCSKGFRRNATTTSLCINSTCR